MSNAGSFSDLGDDSDFDEARAKKRVKGRGRGKPTSSPTKPGVKPRTSVTGLVISYLAYTHGQ